MTEIIDPLWARYQKSITHVATLVGQGRMSVIFPNFLKEIRQKKKEILQEHTNTLCEYLDILAKSIQSPLSVELGKNLTVYFNAVEVWTKELTAGKEPAGIVESIVRKNERIATFLPPVEEESDAALDARISTRKAPDPDRPEFESPPSYEKTSPEGASFWARQTTLDPATTPSLLKQGSESSPLSPLTKQGSDIKQGSDVKKGSDFKQEALDEYDDRLSTRKDGGGTLSLEEWRASVDQRMTGLMRENRSLLTEVRQLKLEFAAFKEGR